MSIKEKKKSKPREFRNFYEEKENRDCGKKLRLAREARNLTQEGLTLKIEIFLENELKKQGLNEREIAHFLEKKLSEEEKKKFMRKGIRANYSRIAASTVSEYENGNMLIPASFVLLLKKVLGNFEI